MSKITNDGLTRSVTGCFIAIGPTHIATVGVKGLMLQREQELTNAKVLRRCNKKGKKMMLVLNGRI